MNQATIMSRPARMVLRALGWLISLLFLCAFLRQHEIKALTGVLLAGMGIASVHFATMPGRRFYAPLFFSFYYVFGFLATLAIALPMMNDLKTTGDGSYGGFGFTNAELSGFLLTTFAGMSGLLAGTLVMEQIGIKSKHVIKAYPNVHKLALLLWMWFIMSGLVILVLWYFGIGQTGVNLTTKLPRGVASFLLFAKMIAIPCAGLYLIEATLATNKIKYLDMALLGLMVVGCVGSVGGLSRGYLVSFIGLGLAFVFFRNSAMRGCNRILVKYGLIILLMLPIGIYAVNELRTFKYGTGSLQGFGDTEIARMVGEFDLSSANEDVVHLATGRIGGASQLMAALSSGVSDPYIPWAMFLSDAEIGDTLQMAVYGFRPYQDSVVTFGLQFGLFGMLILSGSNWVVFLGCILCMVFVMSVERVFLARGSYAVALFCAWYFGGICWSGPYLSMLAKSLGMLVACMVVIKRMDGMLYERKPQRKGNGDYLASHCTE